MEEGGERAVLVTQTKIEKLQLEALRHICHAYAASFQIQRKKCDRPMLLII